MRFNSAFKGLKTTWQWEAVIHKVNVMLRKVDVMLRKVDVMLRKVDVMLRKVDVMWCNLQFYTFSAHGGTQSSLPQPHSLLAPNESTSHIEPIFLHDCHARKVLRFTSTLQSPSLMSSPESSFQNSISISGSLDDSCMPTSPSSENLLLFQMNQPTRCSN